MWFFTLSREWDIPSNLPLPRENIDKFPFSMDIYPFISKEKTLTFPTFLGSLSNVGTWGEWRLNKIFSCFVIQIFLKLYSILCTYIVSHIINVRVLWIFQPFRGQPLDSNKNFISPTLGLATSPLCPFICYKWDHRSMPTLWFICNFGKLGHTKKLMWTI